MADYSKIIASLSPKKRALLELKLKKQGNSYNSFPLSFAQQRLWFIDQLEPGNPMYNIPSAFRLEGKLDIPALEKAINEIVCRHEILRTSFTSLNGQPLQVVAPALKLSLPVINLQNISHREHEIKVQSLAIEEARKPFDLTRAPLIRATLIQLAEDEYVALLTMHHIISDGWSMGILIREIASLYDAFSSGKPASLPPLKLQYADFAKWQKNWLQGELLEKQLAYWKEKLGTNPPVLELPTDYSRPAMQSFEGASLPFELSKNVANGLNRISREEGTTLFMTLLAGFQAFLYRYTGQEQISVGSPIANRTRAEMENLIGFFVNTFVLHTDLSGDPTFRELLARIKDVTLGAYAHQDLPFEKLVEAIQPERDMSRTPLFQVMFVLQNTPTRSIKTSNLTLTPLVFNRGISQFDLTLNVFENEDGIKGLVEYNTRLFKEATIKRLLNHFEILLEQVVADPNQCIASIPILTQFEKEQLLINWNDTAIDYQKGRCIHQVFEDRVAQNPDALALKFKTEQLTYFELNQRANQLAHYLRKAGVGTDDYVGLCVERSLEMFIGIMGILKAGGAYVPIDPNYPMERIRFILEDTGAPILITQEKMLENIPEHGGRNILVDAEWGFIENENFENPVNYASPDNLCYVIYTSGSTGKPKGVQIQHESVINLVNAYIKLYDCKTGDRVGQIFSYSFDGSVGDIFMALLSGATLCSVDEENRMPGPGLSKLIRDHEISIFIMPPPILTAQSEEGLTTLRAIGSGGESPTRDVIARWTAGDRPYLNLYGPTEATVIVSSYLLNNLPGDISNMLIGSPIDNTQLYILDPKLQPVPIGVAGELYVGGVGLSRGYLNRPDMTAERFIPNPFSLEPGGRLYKTGDLTRFLPDGNIEFFGRIDHQVKIRGFRIELGEIEATLDQHPEIKTSVVIVREDVPGNKLLVAYLISENEHKLEIDDLKEFIKGRLPEYMIPQAFVYLEQLPLTPNGKIDRKVLPAPDWSERDMIEAYVPPRTPVEEMLADIYSKILHVEQIGAKDNFFNLGGHSLLATQVISKIREIFNVELPLRELFEAPVLADLALRVELAQGTKQGLSAPPIKSVPREGELPVSFAQQRLWFLDKLEPDSPLYNIPTGYQLKGKLDINALNQAIQELVQRHENLRTTFKATDGKPGLEIADLLTIPMPLIDLSESPEPEREPIALKLATEDVKRPFDLSEGPLLRLKLFRITTEHHIVILTMHHIISDGWSSGILIREVAALYQAFANEKASPLPALKIQYADFAHWQRNWLQGEVLENQLTYWKTQLSESPTVLELPTDFPRPAVQTSNGAHFTFSLPKDLSDQLTKISRQEGVTQFMTMLAAFQTFLYHYTGQDDISVGTPIANRNRGEIEGLIGLFVNTLVLRTKLPGKISFRQLLSRVRETTLGAYAHQDLPFEKVVDAIQPERNMSHTPLFQVMFMLQNANRQELSVEDLSISSISLNTEISTFDLTLSMVEADEGYAGVFEYNTDLFKESTIKTMFEHFQKLLEQIAVNPDTKLADLSLLTEDQQRQIIEEWNDTETPYPADQCIHRLFETQVAKTPNAVAVISESGQLTYQQLNERANQLAQVLQRCGVNSEVPVGICLKRSSEMIVGLMGILKSGGCYLPLDPDYPDDRLAFMIEDSAIPVLITQQDLVDSLPVHPAKVICLDRDWDEIAQENRDNLIGNESSRSTAYVIYTSGSTGRPKGVMVEHQSVVNHNLACIDLFKLQPDDRLLQFATINFDTAVEEIFPTLMSGATLVLRSSDGILASGTDLLDLIEKYRLTILDLPTAYWHEWVYEMTLINKPIPGALRLVIVGGDKASSERFAVWKKIVGSNIQWLNGYGPTEGTIIATAYIPDDDKNTWEPGSEVPIGKPIANAKTYILDSQMKPVPPGVKGILYIGGICVARGYLNRPDLTAEKFIPDPFSKKPGARLYNTGDLARYLPDGNIEFIGRKDYQVKIRGFRIELAEIEAELEKHELIREAAVIVKEDSPSVKRLIAYCVPGIEGFENDLGKRRHVRVPFLSDASLDYNGNQSAQLKTEDISEGGARLMTISPVSDLDQNQPMKMAVKLPINSKSISLSSDLIWKNGERIGVAFQNLNEANKELLKQTINKLLDNRVLLMNELRAYLKERLPDYMVPAAFMIVDNLPRTPSGKIDRKSLPEPDPVRLETEGTFVAPRNETEEKLAEIWNKVLNIEKIGINDNFFELGGDSILSIQVIAQANQAGLQITPKQFFEHPTVAGLADVAGMGQAIQAEQGLVTGKLPMTPIQRWFFEHDSPDQHHYNQSVYFEVTERLETSILNQAVNHLYEHHDALRMRFTKTDSSYEEYIGGVENGAPFMAVDLSAVPAADLKNEIERLTAMSQSSFDLENGPIMRVVLIDPGEGKNQRLLIVIHHLVVDGVSWRILLDDIQNAYDQIKSGQPAQLPPKSTSFKYWAEKLVEYSNSEQLIKEANQWTSLANRNFVKLTRDFSRGKNDVASEKAVAVSLSKTETNDLLKEVPSVYHTQINDVLLTALAKAYYRFTGSRNMLIELEGHGREDLFDDVDLSRTVGWFTSVYPILLDLKNSKFTGDELKMIKEQLRQVPNHGIGFGLLRYLNKDEAIQQQFSAVPSAEICFNYLGQFDQSTTGSKIFSPAHESRGSDHSPRTKRSHLLEINGSVAGGELQLDWYYSENIHQRATIERLAQYFITELRAIISHCKSPQAGGFTPSDFKLAKMNQKKLDKIMNRLGKKKEKVI